MAYVFCAVVVRAPCKIHIPPSVIDPVVDFGIAPLSAALGLADAKIHYRVDFRKRLCYTLAYMAFLQHSLPYVQIVLSVLLIIAILLQRTGASLGGAFGADNFSSGFHTRRGLEKTLFWATIILGILFALSALINLFIS